MNRYQDIVGKLNYGLFLTVVALLPYPQICLRYACVLWIAAWLLEGRWLSKPRSLKENPMAIPFLLFGAWYGLKALSGLWAEDLSAWHWQMERYLTFGCVVPVGIWGLNECYDWRQVGRVFVISCVVAIPLYVAWMAVLYPHPEWVPYSLLQNPWIHHDRWYTFLSDNISHFKHRLFLCSVELFGIVIAAQVFKDKKWLSTILIIIMLLIIPITGSRQSVLSAAGLMAVGLICELPKRFRLRYGVGILLLGMIVGGSMLKLHPRMQHFDITDVKEMRNMAYDHDVRLNIWGCVLQSPQDYLAYGIGAGQSKAYIAKKYTELGFESLAALNFHPHNQYLEELMEVGIPGLLLFLLAWLSIPLCARGRSVMVALLFITLYLLNMLTDCMFGKFDGIALWSVGLIFIFLQSDAERKKQASRDA